jgi:hypothetical protein
VIAELNANRDRLTLALASAAAGEPVDTDLGNQPSMRNALERFIAGCFAEKLIQCSVCNERRWESDAFRPDSNICKRCTKESEAPRFGQWNEMDPHFHANPEAIRQYLHLLQNYQLSEIEQMLISPYTPIMQVYMLKGNMGTGFKGNCVNLCQNLQPMLRCFPRRIQDLSVVLVRKHVNDIGGYKDFKVRRAYISEWLLFLRRWNPNGPWDVIDQNNLDSLPLDGNAVGELLEIQSRQQTPAVAEFGNSSDDGDSSDSDSSDSDSSAGGYQDGPVHDTVLVGDVTDEILTTSVGLPVQSTVTEQDGIHSLCAGRGNSGDAADPLIWPEQSRDALSEYKTPFLLARSFPTLFPFGHGDSTNKVRRFEVSLHDCIQHLNWYAYEQSPNKWVYPFAKHSRFMNYFQNMNERHRVMAQARVYLKKNAADSAMTVSDLQELARNSDCGMFALGHRMQKYAANILGSDASLLEEKKKLIALMQQEKVGTLWWTLSMPNALWEDLVTLFGLELTKRDNESEEEYQVRWRRITIESFRDNPNIVVQHFYRRVERFVDELFGKDGLNAIWTWYRFEWQKRGNMHVHGMARLHSDPGLADLGKCVYDGKRAARILQINKACEEAKHRVVSYATYDWKVILTTDDIFLDIWVSTAIEKLTSSALSEVSIHDLFERVEKAINAEKIIVSYRNYLLTAWHLEPPSDAECLEREPYTIQESITIHPCANCHKKNQDGERFLCDDDMYISLIDYCERHRHSPGYCMRCDGCKFHFPRIPHRLVSSVSVVELAYKQDGPLKGTLRRARITINAATNDSWLNSHMAVALRAWGANIDMSLLIDVNDVMDYVAKYCNKSETPSKGLRCILTALTRVGIAAGDIDPQKVLLQTFARSAGCGRDRCTQEVSHHVDSLSIVKCSKTFVTINLFSNVNEVNTSGTVGEPAMFLNVVDVYALRCEGNRWFDIALFSSESSHLPEMNLSIFSKYFSVSKGKIKKRAGNPENIVVVYSPNLSSEASGCNFWKYCLTHMYKFKAFCGFKENCFLGEKDSCSDIEEVGEEIKIAITDAYDQFMSDNIVHNNTDGGFGGDSINIRVDELRRGVEMAEDRDGLSGGGEAFERDERDLDFADLCEHPAGAIGDVADLVAGFAWSEDHDFHSLPVEEYSADEFSVPFVKAKWNEIVRTRGNRDCSRRKIALDQLNVQQRSAADAFFHMYNGSGDNRSMLLVGTAGTGKSFVIDAIVTKLLEGQPQDGGNKKVLVLAPTGKAAVGVGGYTLQSVDGLRVPVSNKAGAPLRGKALDRFQEQCKGVEVVIIDEYSMMSLVALYWVNERLKQGLACPNKTFGGAFILLVGDPGQLPPVGGQCLWAVRTNENKRLSAIAAAGSILYQQIVTVVCLKQVERQYPGQERFGTFLAHLRDGLCDESDWRWLIRNTTCENIGPERMKTFHGNDSLYIFKTKDVYEHNAKMLKALGNPILRLNAQHDCPASRGKSTDFCRHLANQLHVCIGAKVLIVCNVDTGLGLANGCKGVIKDFLYEDGVVAPDLPFAIIVEVDEYTGPAFFAGVEKAKWVPLLAQKYEWNDKKDGVSTDNTNHFRLQFPISLAWAWTFWKVQGSTFAVSTTITTEKEHGLTFVGMSRVKSIDMLCIGQGCTLERLTTRISNGVQLKRRLKEDERLQLLHERTLYLIDNL